MALALSPALKATLKALTPDQATVLRTEVASRIEKREAEASLSAFFKAAWPVLEPTRALVWNWHLDTLCGYLESFYRERKTRRLIRLILNVPPGATKSMLASVIAPAWVWTWEPSHRFLCGSNDAELATRDSVKMRRLILSDWYQERWGDAVQLTIDQKEKTYWENTAGGFRQSQGVRASIIGKRGDTTIWDDPHDARQVESDQIRGETLRAWDEAWSTRKNDPDLSGQLIIMQRTHAHDIVGHVEEKQLQDWKKVIIPMRYEGPMFDAGTDIDRPELNDPRDDLGDLFFPERFPEHAVNETEEDLGSYGTAAQHQQRPAPRGGGEIQVDWFLRYTRRPSDGKGLRYIIVDPAGERKKGRRGKKDNTAMGVWETRADGNIYLLEGVRDRIGLTERTDRLFEWHAKYKPQLVAYEEYGMQSDIAHIKDRMEREQYRFRIVELGGAIRKEDRIRGIIPRLERGGIYFPESMMATLTNGKNVDVMELILTEEVAAFPVARFDDFLDMMARIEELIDAKLMKFPAQNAGKKLKTRSSRSRPGSWMSI